MPGFSELQSCWLTSLKSSRLASGHSLSILDTAATPEMRSHCFHLSPHPSLAENTWPPSLAASQVHQEVTHFRCHPGRRALSCLRFLFPSHCKHASRRNWCPHLPMLLGPCLASDPPCSLLRRSCCQRPAPFWNSSRINQRKAARSNLEIRCTRK